MKDMNLKIVYMIKIHPMVYAHLYNYRAYYQVYEKYETLIEVTVNEEVYFLDHFKHFPGEKITLGGLSGFIAGSMHNYKLDMFEVLRIILGAEGKNLSSKECDRIIRKGI